MSRAAGFRDTLRRQPELTHFCIDLFENPKPGAAGVAGQFDDDLEDHARTEHDGVACRGQETSPAAGR